MATVGSGKTYSTLQAWHNAVNTTGGVQTADCYGDVGTLLVSGWSGAGNVLNIRPGEDSERRSLGDAWNAGAHISVTSTTEAIDIEQDNSATISVFVEGMGIGYDTSTAYRRLVRVTDSVDLAVLSIKNCFFSLTLTSADSTAFISLISNNSTAGSPNFAITNNIIYCSDTGNGSTGCLQGMIYSAWATGTQDWTVTNNTLIYNSDNSAMSSCYLLRLLPFTSGDGDLNVYNNVIIFIDETGTECLGLGTPATGDRNFSENAYVGPAGNADIDLGGDYNTADIDLTTYAPFSGGQLHTAGNVANATAADHYLVTRKATPDIGAIELVALLSDPELFSSTLSASTLRWDNNDLVFPPKFPNTIL